MRSLTLPFATFAAYIPASFASPLADDIAGSTGASADPALLVVPFCAAFAIAFPWWGRRADGRSFRRVIVEALLALAAAGALLAAASSTGTVALARVLEGLA